MSKIDLKNVDFETLIIHAGQEPDKAYGSLATPIYQTSTFCFETVEEAPQSLPTRSPASSTPAAATPPPGPLS